MRVTRAGLVTLLVLGAACGDSGSQNQGGGPPEGSPGGNAGAAAGGEASGTGAGGAPGAGGGSGEPPIGPGGQTPAPLTAEDRGCPDIFTQETMRTYEVEIAPEEWARLEAEFRAGPPLLSMNEEKTN
jgi:hypothetical protein